MFFNIKIFTFFIILFVTLQSVYFYQINLAPFPIIAFLGLLAFSKKMLFDFKLVNICSMFLVLFTISAIIGILLKIDFYYVNSLLGISIGPIFLLLAVSLIKRLRNETFASIIKNILIVHISFFLIQFVAFYVFKRNIDYLVLLTGEESRLTGFGAITGLARCTGLFNEPATYSYYIFFLVYSRYLANKTLTKFDQIALLTMLMTLSISGVFLFIIMQFFYWVIIKKNIASIVTFCMVIMIGVFVITFFFQDTINLYFVERLNNIDQDSSANIRFSGGLSYFFSLPLIYILLGMGVGNYSYESPTATSGLMAIVTNFGAITGFFFFLLLFIYFHFIKISLKNIFPFVILLFSTFIPNLVIFWLILASLSVYPNKLIETS